MSEVRIIEAPPIDTSEIVTMLEEILADAKAGQTVGIVVLQQRAGGEFCTARASAGEFNRVAFVGQLRFVEWDLIRPLYEDR